MDSDAHRQELHQLCVDFIASGRVSEEILDALRMFVTSDLRPLIKPTYTSGVKEIEERQFLGRSIQTAVENYGELDQILRPAFWRLVMTAPLVPLRSFAVEFSKANRISFMEDGFCVLCGRANPSVCHIIPFSVTRRKNRFISAIKTILGTFWSPERASRLRDILSDNAVIDSARNMLCLEPQLHYWWGLGYLALEPLEELPNGSRVRLRWLTQTRFTVREKIDLGTDPRDHLVQPSATGVVGMRDLRTGRPLLDGSIFELTTQDLTTKDSHELLQLQWDLLKTAAMCGAAEAADDPSWDPEAEDPQYVAEQELLELEEEAKGTNY
ncbi:uncharacterized protein DNG_07933 [Cephalotrichum gorgonifer]|uniref:HNH nuclease domain-containing protein n=1 Tax=Cephalotrichum gorgonifer TaxID=2041049 RepID=A0AAE8N2J8_9PEZI|nr:uncharacterized protein DNG_07933 [Cephalotrichum gorgonifer]